MLLTPVQPPTRDGPLHRASRGKPQPTQRLSGLAVESMVRHRMTPGRSRYRLPRPLRGASITTWAWWEVSTASPILAWAGTWVSAFEVGETASFNRLVPPYARRRTRAVARSERPPQHSSAGTSAIEPRADQREGCQLGSLYSRRPDDDGSYHWRAVCCIATACQRPSRRIKMRMYLILPLNG